MVKNTTLTINTNFVDADFPDDSMSPETSQIISKQILVNLTYLRHLA